MIRVLSDLHYGDRSSRVRTLAQVRPLRDGPDALVLNGDTLDTRPGPRPEFTAERRAEAAAFFGQTRATFLTGNHDPDISSLHSWEFAEGEVFVVHGDVLFESIVPWSRDSALIGRRIRAAIAALPPGAADVLENRLGVYRQVAAGVRQRHQSEPHALKYAVRYAFDAVWPVWRPANIFGAWYALPGRAAALARRHRPKARFIVVGHTHRPGIWRQPDGIVVINTGSFCVPLGGLAVDLLPGRLEVRRVEARGGEFHAGEPLAEWELGKK